MPSQKGVWHAPTTSQHRLQSRALTFATQRTRFVASLRCSVSACSRAVYVAGCGCAGGCSSARSASSGTCALAPTASISPASAAGSANQFVCNTQFNPASPSRHLRCSPDAPTGLLAPNVGTVRLRTMTDSPALQPLHSISLQFRRLHFRSIAFRRPQTAETVRDKSCAPEDSRFQRPRCSAYRPRPAIVR